MTWPTVFSPAMDRDIETMIRSGKSWADIGRAVGQDPTAIRQRVERTLKRHDLVELAISHRQNREPDASVRAGAPRPWGGGALPPGHPMTWGIIVAGTCLADTVFEDIKAPTAVPGSFNQGRTGGQGGI